MVEQLFCSYEEGAKRFSDAAKFFFPELDLDEDLDPGDDKYYRNLIHLKDIGKMMFLNLELALIPTENAGDVVHLDPVDGHLLEYSADVWFKPLHAWR